MTVLNPFSAKMTKIYVISKHLYISTYVGEVGGTNSLLLVQFQIYVYRHGAFSPLFNLTLMVLFARQTH